VYLGGQLSPEYPPSAKTPSYVYYKYDDYNNVVEKKGIDSNGIEFFLDLYEYEYDKHHNWILKKYRGSEKV